MAKGGTDMRRIRRLLAAWLLIMILSVTAEATTGVSKMSSFSTVSSDGNCQVNMTVTLHMEQAVDRLYFPVPKEATGVTLNGSLVSAARSGDVRRINLSRLVRGVVGDVTVTIHYGLRDVIHTTEEGGLELRVPMLSGFNYPVEAMEFSVTLPGQIDVLPAFVSGYHQARIEEDLVYQVEGAMITGTSIRAMKDHETLTMTMAVTEAMFPQNITKIQNYDFGITGIWVCIGLAVVYWIIALWSVSWRVQDCTEPPEGFHAGQLCCIVAGQGTDLSLTVLSWAQLGYLTIRMDKRNRVYLHKRMEMGNERSEFEQRCFNKLFGKKTVVDTTSLHYAQLSLLTAKRTDGMKELVSTYTGNPKVFRVIASGVGLFGGASLAVALANGAALQGLLIFVLGIAGAVSGWFMQDFGAGLILRHRIKLTVSLVQAAIWTVLSLLAGAFSLGMLMVLGTLAMGLLLAWGGRRTPLGKQVREQVRGLRRYLRTADKTQLQRICDSDPDYFFRLAPSALALGADQAFAKRFGKKKLEHCPYLIVEQAAPMSALMWSRTLRKTLDSMDERARMLPLERLLGILQNMIRR